MSKILNYVLERLKEKSTILTLLTLGGGFAGANFAPEQTEAIVAAVTGIVSAIAVFTKEAK